MAAAATSKYQLLKTSLVHHSQLYFDNSSLHGVRFIREKGRPFVEKFLWFACTAIGGVVSIIIILSLWEKFQTSPTITGLDTDTHNWIVPFPAVSLCPSNVINEAAIEAYVQEKYGGNEAAKQFFKAVGNYSYATMASMKDYASKVTIPHREALGDLQVQFAYTCEDVLEHCVMKGTEEKCCEHFKPQLTEVGFCFAFNTRHTYKPDPKFVVEQIRETDDNLSLFFNVTGTNDTMTLINQYIKIFLYSNDEIPTIDDRPQLTWRFRIENLFFSEKNTYTTTETRQLSIHQRRCVFPDEINVDTDIMYTYSACMTQCRMRLARTLCGCVPFFYKKIDGYRHCRASELKCLAENAEKLTENRHCRCNLGCMNTKYEVERMQDQTRFSKKIELSFVSWPMVRYKREVLFGWVDLLVSFGGIMGLFLGFSILSGVEIIYYFTMRAWCMVYKDESELCELQKEYDNVKKPPLDLSLTPYFMKSDVPGQGTAKVSPLKPGYKAPYEAGQFHTKYMT